MSQPPPDARTSGAAFALDGWRAPAEVLTRAVAREPDPSVRASLAAALSLLGQGDYGAALAAAAGAAARQPRSVSAHRIVGLSSEGLGDWSAALQAFQSAHRIDPASGEILADLGRLAMSMGLAAVAADFFARALAAGAAASGMGSGWVFQAPAVLIRQLCQALRESGRAEMALETLQTALATRPDDPELGSALASALLEDGSTDKALAVAEAVLQVQPHQGEALYARALARFERGDLLGAEADCSALMTQEADGGRPATRFLRAQSRLARGDFLGGWSDYEARLDPGFPGAPRYDLPIPRWPVQEDLAGRRLLVMAEQGIGDELMFASMAPDLLALAGEGPAPALAASSRLTELLQRSFPRLPILTLRSAAEAGRAPTLSAPGAEDFDVFTPIGSLAARLRAAPSAFPRPAGRRTPGALQPDPAAIERWRARLEDLGPGLKVGVSWKSARTGGHRAKLYPPLEAWGPMLKVPGVTFVTLQYGEIAEDLEAARGLGAELWIPPGLDLTADIDGAAALSAALDLAVGVANASTVLAAAVATPTWFILPRSAWPLLGQDRHPWFADTRLFQAASFDRWPEVFAAAAAALLERAEAASAPRRPRKPGVLLRGD